MKSNLHCFEEKLGYECVAEASVGMKLPGFLHGLVSVSAIKPLGEPQIFPEPSR
jgi:hypothetical protein